MIYLKLFWSFFQVGILSFGGGYAALPQIQSQVFSNGWLTQAEFLDVLAISEVTPGPIAINAATFVGTQVAGILGAVVSTAGCVAPSCIIVLTLAAVYYKFRTLGLFQQILSKLRPAVVAMIASAGISILITVVFSGSLPTSFSNVDFIALAGTFIGILLLRLFKPNPIFIILGFGLLSLAVSLVSVYF